MSEDLTTFRRICDLLDEQGHLYSVLEHEHVHSSADAAKVRGTRLEEAAKALVLHDKDHDTFLMCVVSGHKRLDLKKVKALLGSKDVSLADPDDVLKATGCPIGTVPPFPGLFAIPGYCDTGVLENEHVVFSAGSHYKSIRMRTTAWKSAADVETVALSQT